MAYEAVIGLEIHAELATKTKMFCFSRNDPDEKHPNMNICPICMGHPGTLPVINSEAVKKVIQVGLALGGTIPEHSQFDRKNYFYPDLPKGYQISQYEYPLVQGGEMDLPGGAHIRIRRIHLEEDTGRLIHDKETNSSLVDFNRAGIPLMELVTEPDFGSGEDVKWFGEELQRILRYLNASSADMEKGEMRVEVNISLRQVASRESQNELGTKVEIKNINSFKFAADAVEYEVRRQSEILAGGGKITQETRGWDESRGVSFSQRTKENAHDYRYFPEPDLPPLRTSSEYIEGLRAALPELPKAKRSRFYSEYGLDKSVIEILIRDKSLADYFESVFSEAKEHDLESKEKPIKSLTKVAAALMTGDFLRLLRETFSSPSETLVSPENFAELVVYLAEDKVSNLVAKEVLEEMFRTGQDPSDLIDKKGLWQISKVDELEDIVSHIVEENPKAAQDYRDGKTGALQYLVGRVMKDSRGKANPKVVQEILERILG